LNPDSILQLLRFTLDTPIDIETDLLFFDEIQDCPRALTSLKYFSEQLPGLAVCCAGSLLGVVHSSEPFPVGSVTFLNLYPLSFEEYLLAADPKSHEFIRSLTVQSKIPDLSDFAKYAQLARTNEVVAVFESIPAQLSRARFARTSWPRNLLPPE
jgi:predicted AAA+ superfamily ATPase